MGEPTVEAEGGEATAPDAVVAVHANEDDERLDHHEATPAAAGTA